jgi:hypothetical protein
MLFPFFLLEIVAQIDTSKIHVLPFYTERESPITTPEEE